MMKKIIRKFSTLTKDKFPNIKRGNYSVLKDGDIQYFEKILGKNQIITDADEVKSYNSDWLNSVCGYSSIVLKPKTTEEVSVILKYCNDRKLAVCPQGGNTGLVGGSVPVFDEVIISSTSMNKILSFDSLTGVLVCQSGCILESLMNFLKEKGFIMPLDLGAKGSCHIGGNVSTNAGGLRLIKYGSLHNTVLGLQAVLANGDIIDSMNTLKKDNTGYHLKHLFIGSEGTLGFITKVAIQCPPFPNALNLALLSIKSYDDVLNIFKLARSNLAEILSSCELMDQVSVDIVKKNLDISCPLPSAPFYILLETSGSDGTHDEDKLNKFLNICMDRNYIIDGLTTSEPSKMKVLWSIRENITNALLKDGYSYKYDISLSLQVFYQIVIDLRKHLKNVADVKTVCGYGHIGDGNLHVNLTSAKFNENILNCIEPYIFERVSEFRGSISAEHGIGFFKNKYIKYSKTENEINIMKSLKSLMDPNGIMNPYKTIWNLRDNLAEGLRKDGFLYCYDISIPLNKFTEAINMMKEFLRNKKEVLSISGFGHIGDGNLHLNVTTAKFDPDLLYFMETKLYPWVSSVKGSISSEHGIGFLKLEFLMYSKTKNEIALMKQLKTVMDRNNILNPLKVLS